MVRGERDGKGREGMDVKGGGVIVKGGMVSRGEGW